MKVNLVYENHWNFGIGVGDTFKYIQLALSQSGWETQISKQLEKDKINILLEAFDSDYVTKLQKLKNSGGKIIVIATEFITKNTFNDFSDFIDTSYYSDKKYWKNRYENFLKVAQFADDIWHLSDFAAEEYSKDLNKKVKYLPHYHVDKFQSVNHREKKDIDFLFTGSITDYRKEVLHKIESMGFKVEYSNSLTAPFHRDDLIARSKICLNIPQFENWPFPSQSRYFYHLENDSFLVSPKTEIPSEQDRYIFNCEPKNYINYCKEQIEKKDFVYRASQEKERFKDSFDIKATIDYLMKEFKNA